MVFLKQGGDNRIQEVDILREIEALELPEVEEIVIEGAYAWDVVAIHEGGDEFYL